MFRMKLVNAMTAVALLVGAAIVFAEDSPSATTSTPATSTAPAKTAKSHSTSSASSTKHTMKLDLNSASAEELSKLPGLDAATAEKIVAARPFKSRSELVNKKIVTKAEYSKIESHIMVKSTATAAK